MQYFPPAYLRTNPNSIHHQPHQQPKRQCESQGKRAETYDQNLA